MEFFHGFGFQYQNIADELRIIVRALKA